MSDTQEPQEPQVTLKKPRKYLPNKCNFPKCIATNAEFKLFYAHGERCASWVAQLAEAFPDVTFPKNRIRLCQKHFSANDIKYVPYPSLVPNAKVMILEQEKANYDYPNYVREVEGPKQPLHKMRLATMRSTRKKLIEQNRKLKEEVKQLKEKIVKLRRENQKLKRNQK